MKHPIVTMVGAEIRAISAALERIRLIREQARGLDSALAQIVYDDAFANAANVTPPWCGAATSLDEFIALTAEYSERLESNYVEIDEDRFVDLVNYVSFISWYDSASTANQLYQSWYADGGPRDFSDDVNSAIEWAIGPDGPDEFEGWIATTTGGILATHGGLEALAKRMEAR